MPGMRKEIPKAETYNKYGDAARKVEIEATGKHGAFKRSPCSGIPEGESLIAGRFVYTMGNKPIAAGRKKTGAEVGENRKLEARFCAKGFREFAESNASAPTVQLQSIRLRLAVIAYRKRNFRVMDVSGAFSRSGHLRRDTYVKLPAWAEEDNVTRKLLEPLYGMSTSCKDWYKPYEIS